MTCLVVLGLERVSSGRANAKFVGVKDSGQASDLGEVC